MTDRRGLRRTFTGRALGATGALVLFLATGCGGGDVGGGITPPPPPAAVASVSVTPDGQTLTVGGTLTLSAVPKDAQGNVLAGRSVAWQSSDQTIASVSPAGVVTGINPGTVTITATVEGKAGATTMVVRPVPVASVLVAAAGTQDSLTVGRTLQLTATPKDASGNLLANRTVAWSTSDAKVATVGAAGLVSGVAPGAVTVTATIEGVAGTRTLVVVPAPVATVTLSRSTVSLHVGDTTRLVATPTDAARAVLAGRAVAWTTSEVKVASVTTAGLVMAIAPGTATVTATSEGKSATAAVVVSLVPVASVAVRGSTSILAGDSTTLVAVLADAAGAVLSGRAVTWSSTNESVATASPAGVVRGIAPGTATIAAAAEGVRGTLDVVVSPVPVASVSVTPASLVVPLGETRSLAATPLDVAGRALTGRTATWSSATPAVATVGADGVVAARSLGTTVVTATVDGRTGQAAVTVVPPPVASVAVSAVGGATSLEAGLTLQLAVALRDAAGDTLAGRAVAWSTANALVATVDSAGRVSGIAAGTVTVTATAEGKSGSLALTVTQVPARLERAAGDGQTAAVGTAVAIAPAVRVLDRHDLPVAGVAVAFAAAGNGSVAGASATTNAAGVATVGGWTLGTTAGAQTLVVSSGALASIGITATATPGPVASLRFTTTDTLRLVVGDRVWPDVVATDRYGNDAGRSAVSLETSNAGAVGVGGGLVAGAGPGVALITARAGALSDSRPVAVDGHPVGTLTARLTLSSSPPRVVAVANGRIATFLGNSVYFGDSTLSALGPAYPVASSLSDVALTPDGRTALVIAPSDSTLSIIDVATRALVGWIPLGATPNRVVVSRDGRQAYITLARGSVGQLAIVDVAASRIVGRVSMLNAGTSLVLGQDGLLYTAGNIGATVTYDISVIDPRATPVVARTLFETISTLTTTDFAVSRDGKYLYLLLTSSIRVIRVADGVTMGYSTLPGAAAQPTSVVVSPDGAELHVTDTDGGRIIVFSLATPAAPVVSRTLTTDGFPARVTFDARGAFAIVPNGRNWLDLVR